MRIVRVPTPSRVPSVAVEGPFSQPAKTQALARARLASALVALPGLDLAEGSDGWTVLWHGVVLAQDHLLKVTLWCDRSTRGRELLRAVAGRLEAAGFTARLSPRDGRAVPPLRERAAYVRVGAVQLGLDPRTAPMLAAVDVVDEERDDVDLGLTFTLAVQRCPACGVDDHPARLVAGFPDGKLLLAAHLGEVAFASGGTVDRRSRNNAACRRCGHEFVAR